MCDFFGGAYCFEFSWNGIREINLVNNLKTYITLGKLKKKDFQQIGGKSRFDPLHLKALSGVVKSNKFFS
jgi:hypothetical protein